MYVDPSPSKTIRILIIQCSAVGGAHLRLAIESSGLRTRVRVIDDRLEAVRAACASIRAGEIIPDLILAEIDPSQAAFRELIRSVRTCSEWAGVPLLVIGECDRTDTGREVSEDGSLRPVSLN